MFKSRSCARPSVASSTPASSERYRNGFEGVRTRALRLWSRNRAAARRDGLLGRHRPGRRPGRPERSRPPCRPRGAPHVVRRSGRAAAAGGGQHLDQQRVPVRTQTDPFEEFFRRFGAPDANPQDPQAAGQPGQPGQPGAAHPRGRLARLGLHHLARRLCRHQQPSDPGRRRHRHGRHGHRHLDQPQGIYRRASSAATAASDLALLKIERQQSAVRQFRRLDAHPGRRLGDRHRQSLWPWRHGHRRHHLGAAPRHHRRRRLRPLHPDRRQHQHGQFAAARCSI